LIFNKNYKTMLKLYCYVDETGQDTKGKFFLVSIVLSGKKQVDSLRMQIAQTEKETKGKSKWTNTDNKRKSAFIKAILCLKILSNCLYYSVYQGSIAYTPLTALSISKAVINKTKKVKIYKVYITIDGLNKRERAKIRKELKSLNIRYDKIKIGLKDEQEVLLRLADGLAGFIRDYLEGKKYAVQLINKVEFKRVFRQI